MRGRTLRRAGRGASFNLQTVLPYDNPLVSNMPYGVCRDDAVSGRPNGCKRRAPDLVRSPEWPEHWPDEPKPYVLDSCGDHNKDFSGCVLI